MERPSVSYILPCLDEADPLREMIVSLHGAAIASGIPFEILITDNGSTDGSIAIAEELGVQLGARILHCPIRGYGAACRFGASHTQSDHFVFLDADGTYSAADAIACAKRCIEDPDAVIIGNRLHAGVASDAMPWTHRYIGTPFFSLLLRILFGARIQDANCGLRGFNKKAFDGLGCRSNGMEFASESLALAARKKLRIISFPITYKRRSGRSKLRTVRDGVRHLVTILSVWLYRQR